MIRLLFLVALILALLWFLQWFRRTSPRQISRTLRKVLIWCGIGLLALAVLTGRLNPLFAALGALIPLLVRLTNLLRLVPMLQQLIRALGLGGAARSSGAAGGGQTTSSIRSRFLEMRLDHASGGLDGWVLDGPFKGRRLGDLGLDELLRMLEFYRESDAQSSALLETYLDREHGEAWRAHTPGASTSGRASAGEGRLTQSEAWSILGLEPGADPEAIRAAHRRLMQRLHPDRGGSDYLAAKINEAKRLLLGD